MKIGKSKSLIGLAVVLALLVGTAYLFLQVTGAQQPKTEKLERGFPSTGTTPTEAPSIIATSPTPPEPPEKPAEPTHREPAPKYAVSARGAYPLSTEAAKPDKVEGYRPPQYSHEGVPVQEGGETCDDAYDVGTLPFNSTGYTCDNIDDYEESGVFDCPYTSTSPDVVYSYTPSANEIIDIDLGGSYYDTKVFVYENDCEGPAYACDDDYHPDYTSAIMGLDVYSGNTYYIVVDGYGGDCGDYIISISEAVECDVVCPPGGIDEGEPDCYDGYVDNYNGGCNSVPNVFQDVNCGDTICGTSGTYLFDASNYRDTDWFRVEVAGGNLTFTCVAEFPLLIFIMDAGSGDCVDYTILGNTTANPCDTATLTFAVSTGVYWLWVGPSVFTGVTCGAEYVAWVDCETPDLWYWKPDKPDQEFPAPSGMPDFDQNQFGGDSVALCGPAAVANCLWWFNAVPPGMNPPDLIRLLSDYFHCDVNDTGTYVDSMQLGLDQYFEDYGFDLQETTFEMPYFHEMEDSLEACQDIILLLGFWWSDDGYEWYREGGHYVTMAGVCSESLKIAISDPDADNAETGAPGRVRPPHDPHPGDPTLHNNPAYVSHDIYDSDLEPDPPSPGNPNWEINYPYPPPGKYTGMNVPDKFKSVSIPAPEGAQFYATEVEYAVMICPKPPEVPPNDDCDGAIEIYPQPCPDVETVYGTTVGATIDCPGVLDWEAVWYKFTLTYACNNVLIDYCPTNRPDVYTRGVVLYDECPADCPNYILYTGASWVTCPSTYTDLTVWWNALPAGTYWLPVFVEDAAGNQLDFGFDICVEECFAEPGDNCADPITVTLPAELPYSDLSQTTCGRVDDYSSTCLGSYDGGEDIIYQINVSTAVDVDILMDPKGTTWTGMAIDNACPPGDPCMAFSTGSSGSRFLPNVHLEPGTYYIMVDTWPSPDCIPDFDLVITEAGGGEDNDDCADATAIGDVIELPFSTTLASFDGPGGCQTAPNIWYCYTAPLTGMAHVALCGSGYDTKLAVYSGCECDPVGTELGCNDDACYDKALQSELIISVVEGNQYLIEVGGYSSNTGDGVLTCTSYVAGLENDNCEGAPIISTFPTTVFGTTVGATIDCPGVLDWDAVWYRFDVPNDCNNVLVDFCPTDGYIVTVGIVLYDECPPDCPGYIIASGYQWNYCEGTGYDNPSIWWNDMPGPASYWFPVYVEPGKGAMDFGFTVSVEDCGVPCTTACPEGGMPEGEPECYDGYVDMYNGGCNSVPYIWQDINCGDTICGTSGVYDANYYRDTDWFRVEVSEGDLTWTCVAEFPLIIFVIDAGSENCSDYTILGYTTVAKCDTASLSFYVSAGIYWLLVMPSDWGNYPCGDQSEYVAWAECQPFGPQIAVDPPEFDLVLNPTGACSSATEDLLISNVGGEDLTYDVTENPPVDWMDVSPTSGMVPPGETDALTVTFYAAGMAEGDYYTDLAVASNDPDDPTVVVPVHLEVELAPEIDIPSRVWMPVVPGCIMDYGFRVSNYGEGELRFEVSVQQNPPPLMARDDNAWENPLQAQWSTPEHRTRDASRVDMSSPAHLTTLEPSGPSMSPPAGGQVMAEGDTLFMQMVHGPDEGWSFATSDDGPGYKMYENFWGVTAPIGDIHWWGFALVYDAGWFNADPADMVFDITFYSDPPGEIEPPTQVVCTYTDVVASYVYYDVYAGFADCWFFSVDLDATCDLSEGWVSIQSQSGGSGPGYTWLLWGSAQTGDGVSCQEGGDCPRYFDQALILTEGGAACPFTVAPESGTVPAESFFDVVLTFDGTLFENCVDDTQTCYLVFTSNDCDEPVLTVDVHAMSARGDVTGDCVINIADVVFLLNYVFAGGPAPDSSCIGDVDRDGDVDTDDALYLVSYLFAGGPPPEIPTAPKADEETIDVETISPIKQTPNERK